MNIDYLQSETVHQHLTMPEAILLMADTLVTQYHQQVIVPQRLCTPLTDKTTALMVMPAALHNPAIAGVKALTLVPNNPKQQRPAIQGLICLFDLQTGAPIAVVDAASITAIRTAAASAVATQVLARKEARVLSLLGTGPQVQSHLHAMLAVRPIAAIKIWGRCPQKLQQVVQRLQTETKVPIQAETDLATAVQTADILCTLTASPDPIVQGHWLKPGVHINMVGAHTADTREVDSVTIQRSRLFVEARAAALQEAGDIIIPLHKGEIGESHIIGELAEVMLEKVSGRTSDQDITAYKSLGNASQDMAAAHRVWEQACTNPTFQNPL